VLEEGRKKADSFANKSVMNMKHPVLTIIV
jgi:hypothetical protein